MGLILNTLLFLKFGKCVPAFDTTASAITKHNHGQIDVIRAATVRNSRYGVAKTQQQVNCRRHNRHFDAALDSPYHPDADPIMIFI